MKTATPLQVARFLEDGACRRWLEDRPSPPFRTLPGVSLDGWLDYHVAEIQHLAEAGAEVYLEEDPAVAIVARFLPWDTEVLGFPVAQVDYVLFPEGTEPRAAAAALTAVLRSLAARGARFALSKTSSADVSLLATLGRAGFDLLTVHLDHLFDTSIQQMNAEPLPGYRFEEAKESDADAVGAASARSYAVADRYSIDPLVPRDRVPEVYRQWGRNSVRGFADLVYVARREDEIVGFGTWGINRRLQERTGVSIAWNGLASVVAEERNRGLFRRIAAFAMVRLNEMGVKWVGSPTNVTNIPTQRCFRSLGAYNYAPILTYRADLTASVLG